MDQTLKNGQSHLLFYRVSNLNRNWSSNFLYIVFLFYTIFLSKCSSFMACLSFCAYIHFQCTIAHSIHVFDKRSEAITALCCYPTFFSKIHSRENYFFFLMFPFVQIYYGKRPFCNYDWLQIVDSSQVVVLARGNQSFALQKSLQRLLRKHCILSLRTRVDSREYRSRDSREFPENIHSRTFPGTENDSRE